MQPSVEQHPIAERDFRFRSPDATASRRRARRWPPEGQSGLGSVFRNLIGGLSAPKPKSS